MRYILIILLSLISFLGYSQALPSGFPTQMNTGWQQWGYQQSTLGTIIATRDTSWTPRYCGTVVLWPNTGVDTAYWMWNCVKWKKLSTSGDVAPVLANNGLSKDGDTIQFGQDVGAAGDPAALNNSREIPFNGFNAFFTGTGGVAIGATSVASSRLNIVGTGSVRGINISTVNNSAINASTSGTSDAIFAQMTGSGNALYANHVGTSGYGLYSTGGSTGIIAVRANTFDTNNGSATPIIEELVRYSSGGLASNGIGATIMYRSQTTGAAEQEAGQFRYYFSNATHGLRSAAFEWHLVNNTVSARKLLLSSSGQWTWDGYPALTAQTDSTTYKPVGIDASGNVVKMANWFGGSGAPSLTATQIAFGSGTNTITSEPALSYDAPTNKLTADSATFKQVNIVGNTSNNTPLLVKPDIADYAGITVQNISTSGSAASAINVLDQNGAGLRIANLGTTFSGAGSTTVLRSNAPGGMVIATDSTDLVFETHDVGGGGFDYSGIVFGITRNWHLSSELPVVDHGAKLWVGGTIKGLDTLHLCDEGHAYSLLKAGHYRDNGYQEGVGFLMLGINQSGNNIPIWHVDSVGKQRWYGYNSSTMDGFTTKAPFVDANGFVKYGSIFNNASGSQNGGQVLFWSPTLGIPTSYAGLLYDSAQGQLYVQAKIKVRDSIMLNDEGHSYGYFKLKHYNNNTTYVEGVGYDFRTINVSNDNFLAFRIDSTGEVRMPAYPSSRNDGATSSALYVDANGYIKYGAISSSGITTLNTLTATTQTFAVGTTGSDFNISSATSTHTFNIPDASTSNRGATTTTSQTFGGLKTFANGIVANNTGQAVGVLISGDRTAAAAPGVAGIGLQIAAFTYTNTSGAGSVSASQNLHLINQPTLTSSNAISYTGDVATIRFAGAPIAAGSSTIDHPWNILANDVNYFQTLAMGVNEQSGDITLGNGSHQIYTGTGGTWTLPSLAGHLGKVYFIKNIGSGTLTVQRGGSDNLYTTSSVTSTTVTAGAAIIIVATSAYWVVE